MDEPPVRYVQTHDGVSIAYQVCGVGPPLVVMPSCPLSHLQLEWQLPAFRRWWEEMATIATVIRYDCRGSGLSDRSRADFSLAAQLQDLAAVVDGLGLARFALAAPVAAGPTGLVYTASYPARVSHLVLWCAYARGADRPDALQTLQTFAAQDWVLFTEVAARVGYGWPEDAQALQYAAYLRACVAQADYVRNLPALAAADATWALPRITARTLVQTRRDAAHLGVETARALVTRIAGAELSILEGSALAPFIPDGSAALTVLRAFLQAPPSAPAPAVRHAVVLTRRELEVLTLLARGGSGRAIAQELAISVSTVQRHIANIYAKVGVRGRVEAAAYAMARGLVVPAD
jgi:DNA-binding NarL/FixJ family response regulator